MAIDPVIPIPVADDENMTTWQKKNYKYVRNTQKITITIASIFGVGTNSVALIFSLVIYTIMLNNGDSNLTTNYLLEYIIPQTITTVLSSIYTLAYIILFVCYCCKILKEDKGIGKILFILTSIVVFIAEIINLISCLLASRITNDFFSNNNVVTYTYYGWMLGLVIVLIIVQQVYLVIGVILLVFIPCLIIF
uniref:Uncharacterized protein n=1 Tax=Mimivirus LCMiAC01 TaxID=2506608 RepID=A0A481Z011_9VIRU|nr:MAG: hypothetical protein LCMiAC01_05240 [Mimivirus LCMiAC01]